jgi:Ca-activated chloride channel family protein
LHSVVKNHEQLPTVRGSQSNDSKHFTYGIPQLAQTGKQSTGFDANGKVIRPTVVSGGTNLTLSAANGSTTAPGKPNSNTVRLGKGRTPLRFGAVQVPSQQSGASKSDRLLGEKQRLAGPKNSTTYSAVRPAPTQRVYTSTDLKEPAIRTNARQLTEAKSLGRRRGLNGAQVFERAPRSERKLGERSDGYAFDSFATTLQGTEQYEPIIENEFLAPQKAPLSTFGIDVDTAAYSNMRRFLNQGQLPPANAVRIEELINYFSYSDAQPEGEHPFSVNLELGPCAWNPQHQLVRVGLKGKEIAREDRPASNLVFLIDVSGSMKSAKNLPLVKTSLHMLVEQMTDNDRIAIVTYAGNAGLQLPSTAGVQKQIISSAIDRLVAGGSTNGEAGIGLAYQTAVDNLLEEGTNRVILCTDGDFNVGVSGNDDLVRIIQDKAKSGVFLSIFGFGMGNLKDAKLEALADKGNGQYGYIDNRAEARKVFVEEMTGTLHTIAKDVKIQVEFNPAYVGEYRLIGYENRVLAAKDFADDKKDAGDIGAGHSVTALYEIVPAGVTRLANTVEGLKYQKTVSVKEEPVLGDPESNELLTVKLRYKQPDGQKSTKVEFPLKKSAESPKQLSQNFQWSSAVAMFGLLLRDSQHAGAASFDGVLEMATRSQGADLSGYRSEFLDLVRKARSLKPVRR